MIVYAIRHIDHPLVHGYIQIGSSKKTTADLTKTRLFQDLHEVMQFYQKQGYSDKYMVVPIEMRPLA